MRRRLILSALLILVAGSARAQGGGTPAYQRGYNMTQFVQDSDGNAGMLWVRPGGAGHDLFLARRAANGSFQGAVQVNSDQGDVRYLPMDEARPSIAAGRGGAVGVSWFDTQGRLRVGISRNHGDSFGESLIVDPGGARPEHAFSSVAFDANGTLFVAWIDARTAPANAEEPAHLYLARIDQDTRPVVRNMTADTARGICGCCRPNLSVDGRNLTVTFRMVTPDGYRDIHRIRTGAALDESEPERLGPPLWKISGCPMAGPAALGEFTWFLDGSTGKKRLMEATSTTATPVPVTAATVGKPQSPRLITGSDRNRPMLYLRGSGGGQVLVRDSGLWRVLVDDVPHFCTDVAWVEGQLLMVGDKEGVLWMEATTPD